MERVIKPTTLGGFVRSLSGLFITKENPQGLSPKECTVLAVLLSLSQDKPVALTKELRLEASNQLNQSLQVTTNYINKFKKKGVVTGNSLHLLFFMDKITISYARETVL